MIHERLHVCATETSFFVWFSTLPNYGTKFSEFKEALKSSPSSHEKAQVFVSFSLCMYASKCVCCLVPPHVQAELEILLLAQKEGFEAHTPYDDRRQQNQLWRPTLP